MTSFSSNRVNKKLPMPLANDYIEFSVDLIYSSNSNEERKSSTSFVERSLNKHVQCVGVWYLCGCAFALNHHKHHESCQQRLSIMRSPLRKFYWIYFLLEITPLNVIRLFQF